MYRISLVSPEPRPVKTIIATSNVCNRARGNLGSRGFLSLLRIQSFAAIVLKPNSWKNTACPPDFKTFQRLCNVCYKRHETGETSSDKFGRCENKYDITDIYIRICMYVHGYLVCIHWKRKAERPFQKQGGGLQFTLSQLTTHHWMITLYVHLLFKGPYLNWELRLGHWTELLHRCDTLFRVR